MSPEANKATLRHTIDEVNAGNFEAVWDLVAEDCEILDQTGAVKTKQEFRREMEEFLLAHRDFHIEVEDLIAEGDRVAARYTESGTWTGPYMGMEPTGKKMSTRPSRFRGSPTARSPASGWRATSLLPEHILV